jgi:hypothetical protein
MKWQVLSDEVCVLCEGMMELVEFECITYVAVTAMFFAVDLAQFPILGLQSA